MLQLLQLGVYPKEVLEVEGGAALGTTAGGPPLAPPLAPCPPASSSALWVQHWPEKSLHILSTTSFTTSSLNWGAERGLGGRRRAPGGSGVGPDEGGPHLLHVGPEPDRRGLVFWFAALGVFGGHLIGDKQTQQ